MVVIIRRTGYEKVAVDLDSEIKCVVNMLAWEWFDRGRELIGVTGSRIKKT